MASPMAIERGWIGTTADVRSASICELESVRQAPHRALVNRAAQRLGQWRRSLARRC
jgi:hypothetical protein